MTTGTADTGDRRSGHVSQASGGARPHRRPTGRPTAKRNTASGRPTTGRHVAGQVAPAGRRPGRSRLPPRRPADRGRRQPAAALLVDVRGAVAGRRAGAGLPGLGGRRAGLCRRACRRALRAGREPGAGRQAAGDPEEGAVARRRDLRRSARPAALRGPAVLRRGAGARRQAARGDARPGVGRGRQGARRGRRHHALHLGHDRPAQGRGAELRQSRSGRPRPAPSSTA